MTAHAVLGASSMYRWAACPGSVRLCADIHNYESSYAAEGSDAHALAAYLLTHGREAKNLVGCLMHLEGREFFVSQDMADAVDIYCDAVEATPGTLHIEKKFDLSSVYPGCFGTADAVKWDDKTKTLTVMDYKHGAGTPVAVKGNVQLRYYATGALLALGYPAEKVKLVIVQPRCKHADGVIRSEIIDALDLLDFCADLVAAAKATEEPNAPLVSGSHCFFCPAYRAKNCPALEKKAQDNAKKVFTPVTGETE